MYKRIAVLLFLCSIGVISSAQNNALEYLKSFKIEHLGVSAGVGTAGFSLEASTPVNEWIQIRTGLSFTPSISTKMGFGVQVGDGKDEKYDQDGNRIETKFEKMSGYMESITGYKVDDRVDMNCHARFANFKLLVDVLPFANKDWHLTAGFYWGNKLIGRACNTTEDMTTTMAVGIYNSVYEKAINDEALYQNMYLPPDICDKFVAYGRMGMHVGDFKKDGAPYMMVPAADGTVRAWARVNAFKPYLGFGWNHAIESHSEWRYGFDAGLLFWGGVPNVYTHDGVSLTNDVTNLEGKVGSVISFVKCFPVYPLLEFKISRTIF